MKINRKRSIAQARDAFVQIHSDDSKVQNILPEPMMVPMESLENELVEDNEALEEQREMEFGTFDEHILPQPLLNIPAIRAKMAKRNARNTTKANNSATSSVTITAKELKKLHDSQRTTRLTNKIHR